MSKEKITLLVPTYQRHRMLARTIDSILGQSFSDLIIRVHDNGSDDETYTMMNQMASADHRIQYFRHPKNIGSNANFQSLIDSVNTPFYAIINDDDFLMPGHLEDGIKLLSLHSEAYFYSSATAIVNLSRNKIEFRNQTWSEALYKPSKEITSIVSGEHFASTGTIFSDRVISKLGCFHPIGMDDVLSVLLTGCFPFVATPRIGAVFTVNEKRDRWYFQERLSLEQILKAGAIDRKFVLDYASPDTEHYLLSYLEYYYGDSIERKAIFTYRNRHINKELNGNYCKKKLYDYLFESCVIKFLKMHASNNILNLLTNLRFLIRKYIYGVFIESRLSTKFITSYDYLVNSNLAKKNNFYDEFKRVSPSKSH